MPVQGVQVMNAPGYVKAVRQAGRDKLGFPLTELESNDMMDEAVNAAEAVITNLTETEKEAILVDLAVTDVLSHMLVEDEDNEDTCPG